VEILYFWTLPSIFRTALAMAKVHHPMSRVNSAGGILYSRSRLSPKIGPPSSLESSIDTAFWEHLIVINDAWLFSIKTGKIKVQIFHYVPQPRMGVGIDQESHYGDTTLGDGTLIQGVNRSPKPGELELTVVGTGC